MTNRVIVLWSIAFVVIIALVMLLVGTLNGGDSDKGDQDARCRVGACAPAADDGGA
jgi:hypothetical protein